VDQVNTAVAQMDKVTQQNAANAEETAASSEELNGQAESLNDSVEVLSGIVYGSTGSNGHKTIGPSAIRRDGPKMLGRARMVAGRLNKAPDIRKAMGDKPARRKTAEEVIPMDEADTGAHA